ncbi:DUF58 domain-containing protein [Acetivibrio cellulolyticus]
MTIFIYLYSYFIGGETSMVMVYMFIFSPIVSVLLIFPFRDRLSVSIDAPSSEVEKCGIIRVSVCIENKSFMPIPFVNIRFCQAVNFSISGSANEIVSLGPFQTKIITKEYTAKSRGIGEIGVSGVWLKDYLNLFKVSILKNTEESRYTGEVTVLPRLVSIKPTSKILLDSSDTPQQDDSGTSTTGFYNWSGEPGYEFREYMAGDPLHKVHWKLSARSETLMVRKDEGRGVAKKRLVLDPCMEMLQRKRDSKTIYQLLFNSLTKSNNENNGNTEDEVLILEEKTLEVILAVANISIKTGREVELWLYEDGNWNKYGITDGKSINEIQHRLASYKFTSDITADSSKRLPLTDIMEHEGRSRYARGGEATVFTGHLDNNLQKAIDCFSDYGITIDIVSVKSSVSKSMVTAKAEKVFAHREGNAWVLGTDDDITEAFS